jgi:hypothetical protein
MNSVADWREIRNISTWDILNDLRSETQLLFIEVVRATNEFRTGDQVWLWLKVKTPALGA